MVFTGFYRVLLVLVSQGLTEFESTLIGFYWVLLGFIGCDGVSQDLSWFHKVLQRLTKF